MPLAPFDQPMTRAEVGGYAVGYFESWNLEPLQAVIVGFSGMGVAACHTSSVPAGLIFNECPYPDWLDEAVTLGFNIVMFAK